MSKNSIQDKIITAIRQMNDNGLRVGQIMSNVFDIVAKDGVDPFFVEDDKLLKHLEELANS